MLSPSRVRYQLSRWRDWSGDGEEAGEGSLEEAGGEGGSAGRSLWRGLSWRMLGRGALLESCGLVNACYYRQ